MRQLLLAAGFIAALGCSTPKPAPDPIPLQFASDEEALNILLTITARYWNPRDQSNQPGLLCCPVIEEDEKDGRRSFSDFFSDPDKGNCATWKSAPDSLIAQLQKHADLIYAHSDQTSGKLLFRARWGNLESMRMLLYSRPVLHDSGLTAAVCIQIETGAFSAQCDCYYLDRQQNGEWIVRNQSGGAIIN